MSKDLKNEVDNIHEIVKRAQIYDKKAFSMIYDLYYDQIYRYAYLKIGNRPDAEDVTQNTFIGALKNIKNFRWKKSGHDFTAWIYTIAHNNIVNYYRKKSKVTFKPFEDMRELEAKQTLSEEIEKKWNLDKLLLAFQGIPYSQQRVLILRFINGMSITETSKIMTKKEGAIKSLQLRAVSSLKKILGGDLNE